MTNSNIKDKVVFITGGSSGIGEATAHHLAKQGAKVAIAARRLDKLENIVADIKAEGGQALAIELDVTNHQQFEQAIQTAIKHFGKLDVLVNNAGLMALAPLEQAHIDEWDKMIDINVKGVLYGIAAALPIFQKQESGQFINMSSVAGFKIFTPAATVYSGTKFAVRAISDGLRQEAGHGIKVTTVYPGPVNTDIKFGSKDKATQDKISEFLQSGLTPEAIANAIGYAVEQPQNVDINEVVVRPTGEQF